MKEIFDPAEIISDILYICFFPYTFNVKQTTEKLIKILIIDIYEVRPI